MTEILPWLFLGSVEETSESWLAANKITSVLNVAEELDDVRVGDRNYLHVKFDDYNTNLNFDGQIKKAVEFIKTCKERNDRILVHCYAGINRSTTTIIFYLALHEGYSILDAFRFIKAKRSIIDPILLCVICNETEDHSDYYSHILTETVLLPSDLKKL